MYEFCRSPYNVLIGLEKDKTKGLSQADNFDFMSQLNPNLATFQQTRNFFEFF